MLIVVILVYVTMMNDVKIIELLKELEELREMVKLSIKLQGRIKLKLKELVPSNEELTIGDYQLLILTTYKDKASLSKMRAILTEEQYEQCIERYSSERWYLENNL